MEETVNISASLAAKEFIDSFKQNKKRKLGSLKKQKYQKSLTLKKEWILGFIVLFLIFFGFFFFKFWL